MTMDLYAILELPKYPQKEPNISTSSEIKKQYYKLALKFHPDKSNHPDSLKKFQEINLAYSVLSDEAKRRNYDLTGSVIETDGDGTGTDWKEYFNVVFKKVTEEEIEKFKKSYVGSEEEESDLINIYNKFQGNMVDVINQMMFGDSSQEKRYFDILEKCIGEGKIERLELFGMMDKKARQYMKTKERKEAAESDLYKTLLMNKASREEKFDQMVKSLEEKYGKRAIEAEVKPAKKAKPTEKKQTTIEKNVAETKSSEESVSGNTRSRRRK